MKFLSVASFVAVALAAAVVDAAFRAGDFVRIEGLEGYIINGAYGCVLKSAEETYDGRIQVIAINEARVLEYNLRPSEALLIPNYFFNLIIEPEYLSRFAWNMPEPLTWQEMLANRSDTPWVRVPVPAETCAILDRVTLMLWRICERNPRLIIMDRDGAGFIFRIVGVWILQKYGHDAMIFVCERTRVMKFHIERVWNGIGAWMI